MKSSETVEKKVFRSLFTESLNSMLHRFNDARATHKDKSKGKKSSQQDITRCGNREIRYICANTSTMLLYIRISQWKNRL